MPNRLATLAYDEAYALVGNGYDDCVRARRAVRGQQELFNLVPVDILAQLLGILQLL